MFLYVSDLQHRNLDFDLKIAPGGLNLLDDALCQESALAATGTASFRSSTREISVRGFLSVVVSFPCDRCLERVRKQVEKEFELVYIPEELGPVDVEREIGESEADIGFYSGDGMDLTDVLRELVLLELPMRRVCEPACAEEPVAKFDVLPADGKNRRPDSRWEALESFRAKPSAKDKS